MAQRLRLALASIVLVVAGSLLHAPTSRAVTTDINNITLGTSFGYLNGQTQYHISQSGSGYVDFRWLDPAGKSTLIAANACSDFAELGRSAFAAGSTSYQTLFFGIQGRCFLLRGRTQPGEGAMANPHDGRVRR